MSDASLHLLVHGTAVAWHREERWQGVCLRGPAGAGKSDLALRLIDRGWRLIADDQVEIRVAPETGLMARAPGSIAGLLEVRGLGPVQVDHLPSAEIVALVDLVPPERLPRMPEPDVETLLGVRLPRFAIAAFAASAPVVMEQSLSQRLGSVMAGSK